MLDLLLYLFASAVLMLTGALIARYFYLKRLNFHYSQIEELQTYNRQTLCEAEIYRRQLVAPETYKQEFRMLSPQSQEVLRPYTKIDLEIKV